MIHGGLCSDYPAGTSWGTPKRFIFTTSMQLKFVTIDVGGDDVDGCAPNGVINETCVQKGLQAVATNMRAILAGLPPSSSNVPFGMVYYRPVAGLLSEGRNGRQGGHRFLEPAAPAQL